MDAPTKQKVDEKRKRIMLPEIKLEICVLKSSTEKNKERPILYLLYM